MSYWDQCFTPVVNYFSNPDVIVYDKPTGQDDADNARIIEIIMVRFMPGKHTPNFNNENSTNGSGDVMISVLSARGKICPRDLFLEAKFLALYFLKRLPDFQKLCKLGD